MNINKKKYIIIGVIFLVIIIIAGTFAWITYQTRKSSLVLVLGEFDETQITLSPYQLDLKASPQTDYTSMEKYVEVTAVNNKSTSADFSLFYNISNIDSALISSDMKYAITRSTNGTSYSEIKTGNFLSASVGVDTDILSVTLSPHSTLYYRIYFYINGLSGNQSSMANKNLNMTIGANLWD